MIRFKSAVLPYVPGCLTALMSAHVLMAADEFCRKSHVLQDVYTETIAAATDEIFIYPLISKTRIMDIRVLVNDRQVYNYTFANETVTFDQDLAVGDDLEVTMYLAPKRDATALPDILYTDYLEGIAAGAVASLVMMPAKGWTNPGLASAKQRTFLHQIGQASVKARQKNLNAPQRIRPRPWL